MLYDLDRFIHRFARLSTGIVLATATMAGACRPHGTAAVRDASVESSSVDEGTSQADATAEAAGPWISRGPGFPEAAPWVSFYGRAARAKDLARVAETYRIINIDADPTDEEGGSNFTDAQIAVLRAGGKNKVLSYLNVGSCERSRSYWSHAPAPFVPCGKNKAAQIGPYGGYPDETWMDPSDAQYQALIVDYVAARLAARKVDGFYLDNMELVEHTKATADGPCSARCRQGGLDLVKRLRDKYPELLLIMQNATSKVTRLGTTGGVRFATLLDGVAHEEVYAPKVDAGAEQELLAWKAMNIRTKDGRPFWIGTEDYVGGCENEQAAREAFSRSKRNGFSPYASDDSARQNVVCYWRF